MSGPFVIAVPAKGRLQEHTERVLRARRASSWSSRAARATIAARSSASPGVEVAYLSASEITQLLAQGAVHFGVTGEDLVREEMPDPDAKVVLIEALGFGDANVVVAVPQAWIDVHRHGRSRRRRHRIPHQARPQDAGRDQIREPHARLLLRHGITDYRIVESAARPKPRRRPAPRS